MGRSYQCAPLQPKSPMPLLSQEQPMAAMPLLS